MDKKAERVPSTTLYGAAPGVFGHDNFYKIFAFCACGRCPMSGMVINFDLGLYVLGGRLKGGVGCLPISRRHHPARS
jgi:hypothetical protein